MFMHKKIINLYLVKLKYKKWPHKVKPIYSKYSKYSDTNRTTIKISLDSFIFVTIPTCKRLKKCCKAKMHLK